jgi:hypothetical protein
MSKRNGKSPKLIGLPPKMACAHICLAPKWSRDQSANCIVEEEGAPRRDRDSPRTQLR